tara:strand:+ start:110 stop:721 length:612 start_codon:yes stop_codon:yes gene_type:complete
MSKILGIIDNGMGNLFSLENSMKYLNQKYIISSNPKKLKRCYKLILPGVGAFKKAMSNLKKKKLDQLIYKHVENEKKILGICLGMQLLGSTSFEESSTKGLNLNSLVYKPFVEKNKKKFHIGYNQVKFSNKSLLFKNIKQDSDFYFVHGYCAIQNKNNDIYGLSKFLKRFVASYESKNIFGVQFHPEKSQHNGLILLKNFLNL